MDRRNLLKLLPKVSLGGLFAGWNIFKDEPEPVEAVEAPGVVEIQRIQEFIREDVYRAFKSSGSGGINVPSSSSSAMCILSSPVREDGFIVVSDYTSSDGDLRSGPNKVHPSLLGTSIVQLEPESD